MRGHGFGALAILGLLALSVVAAAWIPRFSPTRRHARYWLSTSDEGRLAALKSLEAVDDAATRNVFGDAATSASTLASRHAQRWFFERFSSKAAGSWDSRVGWSAWNGRNCSYRTRGRRGEDGSMNAGSTWWRGGVETCELFHGTAVVVACP